MVRGVADRMRCDLKSSIQTILRQIVDVRFASRDYSLCVGSIIVRLKHRRASRAQRAVRKKLDAPNRETVLWINLRSSSQPFIDKQAVRAIKHRVDPQRQAAFLD